MSDEDDQSCSSSGPDSPALAETSLSSAPPIGKHIHFPDPGDEEEEEVEAEGKPVPEIIERSTPSTVRVDSSDLISRCKDFLPLLADPNSLVEETPTIDDIPVLDDQAAKESGEASSTASSDEEVKTTKRKKKKKKKKKKLKTTPVENETLPSLPPILVPTSVEEENKSQIWSF